MSNWGSTATPPNTNRLAAGPQWKPKRCACGARHPSYNRDGGKPGTEWRCRRCDADAEPAPVADPFGPLL